MAPEYRTSDFDYALPPELIAQHPAPSRDESRLMVLRRADRSIEHGKFRDIVELIPKGDALVVNTTKVFRARLLGTRDSGAPAEILLLRYVGDNCYEAMVHPGGKLKAGRIVHVSPDFDVEILETTERRTRIVRLRSTLPVSEAIERFGHTPLPPYIRRADEPADADRYQTIYANETGSVAAPTAGLHFTEDILGKLEQRGVRRVDLLLHVGAGTFKPVETEDPAEHLMHEEGYTLSAESARLLNATRDAGNDVWAVGTTTVRTLETIASDAGRFSQANGETRIFIRPPYRFRAVDHLITNFHLPRSTLLMLVAAFAGYDLVMGAYREAVAERYRFYSYGDAMVII